MRFFRLLVAFCPLAVFASVALGQQTAARPDRGIMPGASYSVSDIENISLTSGNVNMSIPLASLPPIAGGKLKFTLSAVYNSKLWNVTRTENQLGTFNNCANWVVDQPQLSERGGWQITGGYSIQIREGVEDFYYAVPEPYPNSCETNSAEIDALRNYNWYRVVLITPDGAEHDLRPVDNSNAYQGSRGYLYGHYRDTFYTLNTPMRYYTNDGTFISAVIYPSGYSNYFTLTLNDGTKVVQGYNGVQRITDTNGNNIKIFGDANGVAHFQDEQTGREIRYSYDAAGNNGQGRGEVEYQTVTGAWQTVTINFGTTGVKGKLYKINSYDIEGGELGTGAPCSYYNVLGNDEYPITVPVIRKIIYPVTEPNTDPPQFTFEYNSDSTTANVSDTVQWWCGATPQTYTRTVSNGMGELSRVTTPLGATVDYTYSNDETHNFYPLDGNNDIARNIIANKKVTGHTTTPNTTETWTYQIYTAFACGGTVTGPDGSVTTESCFPSDPGFGAPYSTGEFSGRTLTSIRSGKERIDRHWVSLVFDGGNRSATGVWASIGQFNPVVDAEYLSLLDTSGNRIKMSAKTFQYDYNGNVIETKEYDWFDPGSVTFGAYGVPTGVPATATLLRTTISSYYNGAGSSSSSNVYAKRSLTSGTPLILNALQQSTTGPAVVQLSYDGNSYGVAPTVGNLTSKKAWDSANDQWITTSSTYGLYGNLATTTDGRGKVTTFSYLNAALGLPTSVTVDPQNGTGTQTTTTAYDFSTGLVTSTTDPNGNTSTIDYTNQRLNAVDPFGRPGVVIGPDLGSGVNHLTRTFYWDDSRMVQTLADLNSEGDGLLKTEVLSDELGRVIESRQYENSTAFIAVRKSYDIPNRISRTSNPFRAGETLVWTTAISDALGRVVSVTTPDNAVVSTAYSANTVTVTDQAGKQRKSVTDALGRLKEVYEDPNGLNYLTSYGYDTLDNLTQVSQGSQTRTFAYDSLKRLTSASNPESGTVSYQYDNNGNLTQKTDARGVVSTYIYDALNRNTSISYSDGTPSVGRAYDGATNGKGRFWYHWTSAADTSKNNHTAIDVYDAAGRVRNWRQHFWVNGNWSQPPYSMAASYDLAGHITSMTYPSGRTVTNTYDDAGRVNSFTGNLGDGTQRTYATGISYSSFGGMTQEQFGTNTPLYNKKHYNVRGQLYDQRMSTLSWAQNEFDWNRGCLALYYGGAPWGQSGSANNGNVTMQQHWVPADDAYSNYSYTQNSYNYDSLNRLSSVTELHGGPWGQSGTDYVQAYTYDRYGNRTINNGATFGLANPQFGVDTATNRLTPPGGYTMSFDAAGNLIFDNYTGQGARTYDAENRMTGAQASAPANYTYDSDGHRVRRIVNGTETWQIYGFGGELLAEYAAHGSPASPQKEYGYRNGELLITADAPVSSATNFALASNGATAAASSTYPPNGGFAPSPAGAIDGESQGTNYLTTGAWHSSTPTVPQWLEVNFNGSKTIGEIDVFSCQDNYANPSPPTEAMTFSLYGLTAFDVQYWNGSTWLTVPGGNVAGNNKVWKKITFPAITTSKIRVVINATADGWSRVVEVQAWRAASSSRPNVALASNGAVASASTAHTCCGFSVSGAINGNINGPWGNGEGWNDATQNQLPDWFQVDFAGSKTIDEIDVFSLHDNYTQPNTPTETQTFSLYGLVSFEVQYWNGGAWVTIPGGSVTGNNKVWRKFSFAPITTGKIRLWITGVPDDWSRLVEIQAYEAAGGGGSSNATVRWLVTDQLGTPRMVFDQTGSLANVSRHDYLPFGEELFAGTGGRTTAQGYTASDNVRQKFTQKERDLETGLDYFLARYYSSTQGRFTGVDSGPFMPADPQSWNRYAYVQNNPLKFIDPNGTTLTLTGTDAEDLVEELEKKTGYQLTRDSKTGKVAIDKGTKRNEKGTSKDLAKLLKTIIGDKKTDVAIDVGQNQPGVFIDDFGSREMDLADYKAFDAAAPELSALAVGHVLQEYYEANKKHAGQPDTVAFPPSHDKATKFESKVLSNFTGKKEQQRQEANPAPNTVRIIYTTVHYDILLKSSATTVPPDTVANITKKANTKPGVP